MERTLEHVQDGWRFAWSPGCSFINVRPAAAATNTVPYDMLKLPEWVNVARFDAEGFRAVCRVWLERSQLSVDLNKLATYLEAWGQLMTTQKARWSAEWAAETVRRAMNDPSVLDKLPAKATA
jgi:hypothetical protein